MAHEDKYNQFPRGSVWRKWDLHVHTDEIIRLESKHKVSLEEYEKDIDKKFKN